MHLSTSKLLLVASCGVAPAVADFLGPRYPPPKDLCSNNSIVPVAWKNTTKILEKYLTDKNANSTFGGIAGLQNVTFSVGLFSLHDPSLSKTQFHYSSPEVALSNYTKSVNGDSLYRTASVTKVFTVLSGLLSLNSSEWERPLTEIFPTLSEYAQQIAEKGNEIENIQWDKVTPSALSAHIASVPTNPYLLDQIIQVITGKVPDPRALGLPVIEETDPLAYPPYSGDISNITAFAPSVALRAPNFLPWTNAIYSNNGFILLGAALANLTGKTIPGLIQDNVLKPLNLKSTYAGSVPKEELHRSVVVDIQEWTVPGGLTVGSGGIASTTNDLAKFGLSILNSTLLPGEQTRRWLKPVSHTSRQYLAIGRPWEILRYTHASGAVTDIYTKSGNSGYTSSFLVLIPDYDVGFTLLSSSTQATRNALVGKIGDLISNALLPALEAQAAAEAASNYAGTYTGVDQDGLETSLILSVNSTLGAAPGLQIHAFTKNGTDIGNSKSFAPFLGTGARLQPSILGKGVGKVAFRAASPTDYISLDKSEGLFTAFGESDHVLGDAVAYGGISVTLFNFEVAEDGKATSVTPAAFRVKLERKE